MKGASPKSGFYLLSDIADTLVARLTHLELAEH